MSASSASIRSSLILCGLFFLSAACLSQRKHSVARRGNEPVSSSAAPATFEGHYFLAETSRPAVSGKDLSLIRVSVASFIVATDSYPKLSFGVLGDADYVSWSLCKVSTDEACETGTTLLTELLLAPKTAGRYEITLKACAESARLTDKKVPCGEPSYAMWEELGKKDFATSALLQELMEKEKELQSYGPQLHEVLRVFKEELASCQIKTDEGKAAILEDQISTQLENILNLGPAYLAYAFQGMPLENGAERPAELASLMSEELADSSTQQSFSAGGLSLTELSDAEAQQRKKRWDLIAAYFNAQLLRYRGGGKLIARSDPAPAVLANSGLGAAPQLGLGTAAVLAAPLSAAQLGAMSGGQQYAALAAVLLVSGGALVGEDAANDFAGFTSLSSLFGSYSNVAGLSCSAYAHASAKLTAIRDRVRDIKLRLGEIQKELEKIKS